MEFRLDAIDHNDQEMLRIFRQAIYDRLRDKIEGETTNSPFGSTFPPNAVDQAIQELIPVIQAAQVDWMYQYSLLLDTTKSNIENSVLSLVLGGLGRIFMDDYIKNNPIEGEKNE